MADAFSDIQFLKEVYATARNKFKPLHISMLLIVEAPPDNLDRYFYFEDVKKQDALFLEITGVLYPEQKKRYLASGRDTALKAELLQTLKEDGYWMMNLSEVPISLIQAPIESCIPSLLERLQKHINKQTPVILIGSGIFDRCYSVLHANGYNVQQERMPFPGSGQQKIFREKFRKSIFTS